MVKVVFGKKGMGKTKYLIEEANIQALESTGDIVFIDSSDQLMYDLKHKIRFINVSEFPLVGSNGFIGFLCGIISENYDINAIFIDGLTRIIKQEAEEMENFFKEINQLSEKHGIKFYISVSGDSENIPDFIKEFVS